MTDSGSTGGDPSSSIVLISTQLAEIKNSTMNSEREIQRLETEVLKSSHEIGELKAQLAGSVRNAVLLAVSFVTGLAAIGAVLGFGSVAEIREGVEQDAAGIVAKISELEAVFASSAEQISATSEKVGADIGVLSEEMAEVAIVAGGLSEKVEELEYALDASARQFAQGTESFEAALNDVGGEVAQISSVLRSLDPQATARSTGDFQASDTSDVMVEMRTAILVGDLASLRRTVAIASEVLPQLTPRELAVLSISAYRLRDYDLAIAAARQGLRKAEEVGPTAVQDPELISALHARIADSFSELQLFDQAVEAYGDCLEVLPTSAQCLNNSASILMDNGDFTEACRRMTVALSIQADGENKSSLANNLTLCYIDAANFTETEEEKNILFETALTAAEQNLEIANGIEPANREQIGNALYVKAVALGYLGETLRAQVLLDEAIQKSPQLRLAVPSSGRIEQLLIDLSRGN